MICTVSVVAVAPIKEVVGMGGRIGVKIRSAQGASDLWTATLPRTGARHNDIKLLKGRPKE